MAAGRGVRHGCRGRRDRFALLTRVSRSQLVLREAPPSPLHERGLLSLLCRRSARAKVFPAEPAAHVAPPEPVWPLRVLWRHGGLVRHQLVRDPAVGRWHATRRRGETHGGLGPRRPLLEDPSRLHVTAKPPRNRAGRLGFPGIAGVGWGASIVAVPWRCIVRHGVLHLASGGRRCV